MQFEFSLELARAIKQEGLHLALDTCGMVARERLRELASLADLILFDLKLSDEEAHRAATGVPLAPILAGAEMISAELSKPMWVRTPIIPGFTDGEENVLAIARFIHDRLPTVQRYDLLAFNNTCEAKYERLDMEWRLREQELVTLSHMEHLAEVARAQGLRQVAWSGATRREEE